MIRIPEANAPDIETSRSACVAEVGIPKRGPTAYWPRRADASAAGALLVIDGKPLFAYAYSNQDGARYPNQARSKTRIAGTEKLTPGKHTIAFDFNDDGGGIGKGGTGTLTVDGKKSAEGRLDKTIPFRFSLDESFDIGEDTGTPVIDEYDARMPFRFTGTLRKVDFELGADNLTPAQRASVRRFRILLAMATQ